MKIIKIAQQQDQPTQEIHLESLIDEIEVYFSVSAGHYDEAGEAEELLEEALIKLKECNYRINATSKVDIFK